jgi:hypothetical protein
MAGAMAEAMSSDGPLVLSEVRETTLSLACERCGRFVIYSVEKLLAQHGGDAKLTGLLNHLANCPKTRSPQVRGRCKAVYAGLAKTAD